MRKGEKGAEFKKKVAKRSANFFAHFLANNKKKDSGEEIYICIQAVDKEKDRVLWFARSLILVFLVFKTKV